MIELRTLAVDHIHASPSNPRRTFNDATIKELATSIREQGVLQPILVRPLPMDRGPRGIALSEKLDHFEIIAGHRRLRASVLAGLAEIPAVIRELDDIQSLEAAILENLQREDVHPLEEAEGYERLMKVGHYSLEQLLERIGKSKSYVYGRLKLLALGGKARVAFYDGKLTPSTALLIARLPADQQDKAVAEITQGYGGEPLAFRSARDHIERNFMLDLTKATFKPADPNFAVGACTECPKRTGNQPALFAEAGSGDLCSDAACFNDKREVDYLRKKELVEHKGHKVIEGDAAKKIAPHGAGYIEPKTGYVALSQMCYDAPKPGSYEKLLGKDFEPNLYIRDPRTNALVAIAKKTTIAEHLEAKGIKLSVSRSDKEKDNERKAKAETAYREALLKAISARYAEHESMEMSERELRLVAEFMIDRIGHDGRTRLAKLFGEREVKGLPNTALVTLILQCTVIGQVHVPGYQTTIGKPEKLIMLAEGMGIDPAAIKREVQSAAKRHKKKPASTPSHAAQAAGQAPPADKAKPRLKKAAAKTAKEKTDPAPAAPGNEAAAPPNTEDESTVKMFRHPMDPTLTWTGKGKPPAWAKALMDAGQGLECA